MPKKLGAPLLSRVQLVRISQPVAGSASHLIDAIRLELGTRYGLRPMTSCQRLIRSFGVL